MKSKLIAAMVAATLVSACTPRTAAGIRELGEEQTYVFEVSEGYQSTYRKVLEHARRCFASGFIGSQMVVNGDLYTDIKVGTVSVAISGVGGMNYNQVIDIRSAGENTSTVKAHYAWSAVRQYGGMLKRAVLESDSGCSPST